SAILEIDVAFGSKNPTDVSQLAALAVGVSREHLPSMKTKTLIICGRYDVQCPIQYSIEMHEGIRNSIFVTFEESNHYPFLEEADQFTSTTRTFYKLLHQYRYY
ncbi:alpha/beta hydrolase, partial [Bacillus pacificus]|nr:alpha/beta hydrolase [Bacillus pacificus]